MRGADPEITPEPRDRVAGQGGLATGVWTDEGDHGAASGELFARPSAAEQAEYPFLGQQSQQLGRRGQSRQPPETRQLPAELPAEPVAVGETPAVAQAIQTLVKQ